MTANLGDMGIYFWQKPKVAKTFIWLHFVRILFCLDSWQSHDNRSNGGVAFVFVRIFGISQTLSLVSIPKILTSAKLHTPEQIEKTQIAT